MKTHFLWLSFMMIALSTAFAQNQINTTLVGNWGYGDMHAVAKEGSFVYVGSGSMFCVVDVSDSLNPVRKGKLFLNDFILEIIISENFAYVLNRELGLRIVDISDPDTPSLVSTFSTPERAASLAKSGQYVYLGYSNDYDISVLLVIDVINPASPVQVGSKSLSTSPKSIKISGDYAFIAAGSVGMRVLNISDPTTPTNVITKPVGGDAYYIQVSGNYAYIGRVDVSQSLVIMDISNPAIPITKYSGWSQVSAIAVQGNFAYIATDMNGLDIVDVSNPSSPNYVGICKPPKDPKDIVIGGNLAFVVGFDSGLCIIDVSAPENPYIYSSCDIPGRINDMSFADDNLVYLTDWKGMRVIDFSNPGEPQEIGSVDLLGKTPYYIGLNNNYAFVYCYNWYPSENLLCAIDISDPQSPVWLGTTYLPNQVYDFAIRDNFLYMLDYDGMKVYGIVNPTTPSLVFTYFNNYLDHIKLVENRALLSKDSDVFIFDISDPLIPLQLVSYVSENYIEAIDADENYAYLAYDEGMEIVDISEPTNPVKIGQMEFIDDGINDVSTANGYVYLAGYPGLRVIDISNPVLPVEVGTYQNNNFFWHVGAKGYNAFVWNNYQLLVIQNDDFWVNIDEPGNAKSNELEVTIWPNPISEYGVLDYSLQADCYVEIWIIDNSGKEREVILNQNQQKGKHQLSLKCTDLKIGVYYLRITALTLSDSKEYQSIKKFIVSKK
jgi:hypothetical protein